VTSLGEELFGREQVAKAKRYHRPGYAAFVLNTAIGLGVLAILAFAGPELDGWSWWAAAIVLAALAIVCPWAARLPVAYWAGYVRERQWGFSTQMAAGWLGDRAKALAVALVLTMPLMLGLVGLARIFPTWWPLAAMAGGAVVVVLISFLAPLVIEPLFNRFDKLEDEALAGELRALADRAGVPVRDVLVSDASRQTTKVNAYVSGFGRTRRVVLFDTLLDESSPAETKVVVAHELGHRKGGHIAIGTLLAVAGMAIAVLAVWAVIGNPEPGDIPGVLLIGAALELVALPLLTAISRRWERYADRFSLELTGDAAAFESTFRNLGTANLADLDPPRALYYTLFSHPTVPERIAFGRRWAEQYGSAA